MTDYAQDQGGRFSSNTHRKVLAHLSTPSDDFGWTPQAMVTRMLPDLDTSVDTPDEMGAVLAELEEAGHAERLNAGGTEVWRMTQQGFDTLTGPIANEPPPGAAVRGPALLSGIPGAGGATKLDSAPADAQNITTDDVENVQASDVATGEAQ